MKAVQLSPHYKRKLLYAKTITRRKGISVVCLPRRESLQRKHTASKVDSQWEHSAHASTGVCLSREVDDEASKTGLQAPAEKFVKPESEQCFRHGEKKMLRVKKI